MLDLQAVQRFMVKQNEALGTGRMEEASESEALSRLEAALDRIEKQRRPVPVAGRPDDAGVIASRLDVLIGQLRHALAAGA